MNKIICGDSLEELTKLESDSVDLIVTSPPYFKQRKYTEDKREIGSEIGPGFYLQILLGVFNECVRIIKPTGSIVWNMGDIYKDKSLQLLPYRFAINIIDHYKNIKLINDITWVKSNPTPRQYNKRLVSSTEPFFHFVKSSEYYYDRDEFLKRDEPIKPNKSPKKGQGYVPQIQNSDLTSEEKLNALGDLAIVVSEVHDGQIADFRMKIRGVHKKAFGGQAGGRNNQIDKQGYTIIRLTGNKIKRDVIESSVANTKDIDHPAVFPLTLVKEVIKLLSEKGNVILDPFSGSGQVCVVAKSLDRQYLGIDLSPYYCEIARKRL
jgi:site-specific DNA-methyltransferase (adenine-specific)